MVAERGMSASFGKAPSTRHEHDEPPCRRGRPRPMRTPASASSQPRGGRMLRGPRSGRGTRSAFFHGEEPEAAKELKLGGNFLIASVIEALGEAIALAGKAGIDRGESIDFLTSTLFSAPVYRTMGVYRRGKVRAGRLCGSVGTRGYPPHARGGRGSARSCAPREPGARPVLEAPPTTRRRTRLVNGSVRCHGRRQDRAWRDGSPCHGRLAGAARILRGRGGRH